MLSEKYKTHSSSIPRHLSHFSWPFLCFLSKILVLMEIVARQLLEPKKAYKFFNLTELFMKRGVKGI
jgi:hypothetical protein